MSDGTKIEWTESVRRAGDHHELIDFERARVAASRVKPSPQFPITLGTVAGQATRHSVIRGGIAPAHDRNDMIPRGCQVVAVGTLAIEQLEPHLGILECERKDASFPSFLTLYRTKTNVCVSRVARTISHPLMRAAPTLSRHFCERLPRLAVAAPRHSAVARCDSLRLRRVAISSSAARLADIGVSIGSRYVGVERFEHLRYAALRAGLHEVNRNG